MVDSRSQTCPAITLLRFGSEPASKASPLPVLFIPLPLVAWPLPLVAWPLPLPLPAPPLPPCEPEFELPSALQPRMLAKRRKGRTAVVTVQERREKFMAPCRTFRVVLQDGPQNSTY